MVPAIDAVRAALAEFVAAFNALDWDRFADLFAAESSLYAPAVDRRRVGRIDGRAAVLAHFRDVFANERAAGHGPDIRPDRLDVQMLGDAAALATFDFARAQGSTGRRSIVLRLDGAAWRIVHIHASNGPPADAHEV